MKAYMDRYSWFMKRVINLTAIPDEDRYGRSIVTEYAAEHLNTCEVGSVLDLAAGLGDDLFNIRNKCEGKHSFYALDAFPPNVRHLRELGINVRTVDIEKQIFPIEDAFF